MHQQRDGVFMSSHVVRQDIQFSSHVDCLQKEPISRDCIDAWSRSSSIFLAPLASLLIAIEICA